MLRKSSLSSKYIECYLFENRDGFNDIVLFNVLLNKWYYHGEDM